MKQAKFIFVLAAMVALCVSFSSCSKDKDDDNPLVGTTWVWEYEGDADDDWQEIRTIKFTTKTAGTITYAGDIVGDDSESQTFPITYTFNDHEVIMMTSGVVAARGEVRGTKMTLTFISGDEDEDEELVFTKK